jgi:DNA-binding IclR family transcriptional regulator
MSTDADETTERILASLRERPALNTPALIAQDLGVDRDETTRILEGLKANGKVKQSVMGWKLPRS